MDSVCVCDKIIRKGLSFIRNIDKIIEESSQSIMLIKSYMHFRIFTN